MVKKHKKTKYLFLRKIREELGKKIIEIARSANVSDLTWRKAEMGQEIGNVSWGKILIAVNKETTAQGGKKYTLGDLKKSY